MPGAGVFCGSLTAASKDVKSYHGTGVHMHPDSHAETSTYMLFWVFFVT